jgi:hypothetical protein
MISLVSTRANRAVKGTVLGAPDLGGKLAAVPISSLGVVDYDAFTHREDDHSVVVEVALIGGGPLAGLPTRGR